MNCYTTCELCYNKWQGIFPDNYTFKTSKEKTTCLQLLIFTHAKSWTHVVTQLLKLKFTLNWVVSVAESFLQELQLVLTKPLNCVTVTRVVSWVREHWRPLKTLTRLSRTSWLVWMLLTKFCWTVRWSNWTELQTRVSWVPTLSLVFQLLLPVQLLTNWERLCTTTLVVSTQRFCLRQWWTLLTVEPTRTTLLTSKSSWSCQLVQRLLLKLSVWVQKLSTHCKHCWRNQVTQLLLVTKVDSLLTSPQTQSHLSSCWTLSSVLVTSLVRTSPLPLTLPHQNSTTTRRRSTRWQVSLIRRNTRLTSSSTTWRTW